jgi:hypothetical protein
MIRWSVRISVQVSTSPSRSPTANSYLVPKITSDESRVIVLGCCDGREDKGAISESYYFKTHLSAPRRVTLVAKNGAILI